MSMTTQKTRTETTDALALLKEDHQKVKKAFEDYSNLGDQAYKSKKSLADEICHDLIRHTKMEEEVFYPEFQKAVKNSTGLVNEAKVEHDTAKNLIEQILDMDSHEDLFDAKVTVLSEYVKHHIKEEEEEMFPKVRKANVDLGKLGEQLLEAKDKLD